MNAEELFNTITSNGMREMTLERFKQAVEEHDEQIKRIIDNMITNLDKGKIEALTELRSKLYGKD